MKRVVVVLFCLFIILFAASLYLFVKERKPLTEVTLYGNVDVRQVDLGFRVGGRVIQMPFQEGAYIKPSTLLARLDKQPYLDEVRKAKASVRAVKASLKNAELLLKRRKVLFDAQGVSREDYETARSNRNVLRAQLKEAQASVAIARTNLRDTKVYAPNSGVILTRIREPGTVVREADPVYTLSLTDPVWIRAFVSEPELGLIYPGMKAEIYTDTPAVHRMGEKREAPKVYSGHIGFISPIAEFTPKTVQTTDLRTALVYRLRVIADNPDQGLKQGMPVTVKLSLLDENSKNGNDEGGK